MTVFLTEVISLLLHVQLCIIISLFLQKLAPVVRKSSKPFENSEDLLYKKNCWNEYHKKEIRQKELLTCTVMIY